MSQGIEHYLSDIERAQSGLGEDDLSMRRLSALRIFKQSGFPTTRQENWKYTDVRPITKIPYSILTGDAVDFSRAEVDALRFAELDCIELVFTNGIYSSELSRLDGLPEKIIVENMATALSKDENLLSKHLTKYADDKDSSFTALNTAFIQHGAYINIPRGVVLEKPINLLYLSKKAEEPFASHPRNLIVMGEQAEASVIESYVGLNNADYFTNVVTEVSLAANAILKHFKLQQESENAYHIGNLNSMHGRDSRFESHSVALGGALARSDIHSQLATEGASVEMNGLYMTRDKQHIDNHTRVDHLEPNTHSVENYRGVLIGKSRAVFNGKVIVHPQAQKIEAHQNNANLLLSDDAEIDTKPELEIYADDVKCSHGATVGQLDQDMLFYLQSRAIEHETARSLLTFAFADEVINKIDYKPIRDRLEYLVVGQLPDADLVREFTYE